VGADHTSGYSVATNILKVRGFVDPLKKEEQIELSRNLHIATAPVDFTGLPLHRVPGPGYPGVSAGGGRHGHARFGLGLGVPDVISLGTSSGPNTRSTWPRA